MIPFTQQKYLIAVSEANKGLVQRFSKRKLSFTGPIGPLSGQRPLSCASANPTVLQDSHINCEALFFAIYKDSTINVIITDPITGIKIPPLNQE